MADFSMPTPPERQRAGELEPWRCTSCQELMYNKDENGNPAPGAPMPKFWSISHRTVCSACFEMATAAATPYLQAISAKEREEDAKRKDNNDRLSGKRDYFTGL